MAHPPAMVPYVQIVEQPAGKALRFRYECEGRSAGSIPGVSSTPENRTFPTVKIYGHIGNVIIVVSCVTKDEPYRPHPHNLVGRERCERGVCTVPIEITEDNNEYQFRNLGIQCVKRRDIAEALRLREELRVDPFRTGFDHRKHPQSIDLNAVRLAFQVFLPDATGRMRRPLPAVVSDVIYDKKAMSDLLIVRASHCSGTAKGGTQVILLCEKVTKEDTAVVFYKEDANGVVVWESMANIVLVHKLAAIAFHTPPFEKPDIQENVNVHYQLKRLSDNARSNSLPFEYISDNPDPSYIRGKRRKTLMPMISTYDHDRYQDEKPIKAEPRDKSSPHHQSTSPLPMYPPQYDRQWVMNPAPQLQFGGQWLDPYAQRAHPMGPGPSHQHQDMMSQGPSHLLDMMHAGPSHHGDLSPMHDPMSPMGQQLTSPSHNSMSPMGHRSALSPSHNSISPMGQAPPIHGSVSPMQVGVSNMGHSHAVPMQVEHIEPNLMQQQNNYNQGESGPTSLSALLADSVNSSDFSGLASLLVQRAPDLLSADLKLSNSDLLL